MKRKKTELLNNGKRFNNCDVDHFANLGHIVKVMVSRYL